ncbi:hypothetical protein [Texcoconibacillus texcoconensis]|uniref:Intracellular proteinase inhibitor BsuPI domain-containing protein n=1 Tax=Texcoconibacillus texcoconensis TaxID=1095777 RepID=A0A840QPT6_9BACI|nr:hypothetical protein [Texcoconibacillus texcoconensis]MBB5173333.1 hypothetical protein [Texcoconibacillus texcoconensis]
MNLKVWIVPFISLFMLGCQQHEEGEELLEGYELVEERPVVAETESGDYLLRVVSEKPIYDEDESVEVKAKLKYIGKGDKQEIEYDQSPFTFYVQEVQRNESLAYEEESTDSVGTLKHDRWFEEEYNLENVHVEESDDESFINAFSKKDRVPAGEYEVEVQAVFSDREKGEDQRLSTGIIFSVQ